MPDIFSYLDVHPDSIQRLGIKDSDAEKLQEIIDTLQVMLDDREAITAWLADSRPDLNGQSPKQLIMQGQYEKVLFLVRAWAHGSFG